MRPSLTWAVPTVSKSQTTAAPFMSASTVKTTIRKSIGENWPSSPCIFLRLSDEQRVISSMIDWLTQDAFEQHTPRLQASEIQQIVFDLDCAEVSNRIREPSCSESDIGCVVQRWFGKFFDVYFVFEIYDSSEQLGGEIAGLVHTPFADSHPGRYDWQIIREFEELLTCIGAKTIRWVDSKNRSPECMVSRDDSRGFESPVYDASSEHDAAELVSYLSDTRPDDRYVIVPPETQCDWLVYRLSRSGTKVQAAKYPQRLMALQYALAKSLEEENLFLVQSQQRDVDQRNYEVKNGLAKLL